MTTTQDRLKALKYYGTAYEVCLWHPDGRRYLIGYVGRRNRLGIVKALQRVGERVLAITNMSEDDRFAFDKGGKQAQLTATGWRFGITGRTERDAISQGECERLPSA